MKNLSRPITTLNADERDRLIEHAVDSLDRGEIVVLPTETVYGVFAVARKEALSKLRSLTGGRDASDDYTLHLSDLDVVRDELSLPTPVARRLVSRLLPGPVRVVLEQPKENLQAISEKLGLPEGFFGDEQSIAIRVPDHPVTRVVLRRAGVVCVARRLSAASWVDNNDTGSTVEGIDENARPAPACVIDDGTTHYKVGSTTVTIGLDGRFSVSAHGPVKEDDVLEMLERRVLFVCTGNTCRSPMSACIARALIEKEGPTGITTIAESAGIAADDEYPATPEAMTVMAERGMDLTGHRSRMLTAEMIDRAEIVYTMTHMHAQRVMSLAPDAVHKVFPLSEQSIVEDPIGQHTDVYRKTADQLEELIAERLKEIAP